MKNVYNTIDGIPIKMWLGIDEIESGAIEQAKNLAKLPFAFKHIAIMPDCHQGYGMPIGGVLATKNVIIPNAVGVDIGCGMIAVKTSISYRPDKEAIKKVFGGSKEYKGGIRSCVPVGFSHQSKKQDESLMPSLEQVIDMDIDGVGSVIWNQYKSALKQLGTLGGGNHFIELQMDESDNIWIMIHSGSRNLGYKVAEYYNEIAIALNKEWFSSVPKEYQLAFLPVNSEEGQAYLTEMRYCVDFAFANRLLMLENIKECIDNVFAHVEYDEPINIAHNYAALENHFGKNVWVHRKGATRARVGELGIIPGSQGTKSYIVEGLGNPESFCSCSHGAGRKMSRTKAKENLNIDTEIERMESMGIVHGMRNKNDLDEAAGAYKDIDDVMQNQADLVKIVHELTPIAVIKG